VLWVRTLFASPDAGEGDRCTDQEGAADMAFFSVFAFAAVAGITLVLMTELTKFLMMEEKSVCMFGRR
jgi:hypothetical protein